MKNAPINRVGAIRNLGRWRPVEDLKKDKTMVLVCGPQFGCGYQIMSADICELHSVKFWQPLDPIPNEAMAALAKFNALSAEKDQ